MLATQKDILDACYIGAAPSQCVLLEYSGLLEIQVCSNKFRAIRKEYQKSREIKLPSREAWLITRLITRLINRPKSREEARIATGPKSRAANRPASKPTIIYLTTSMENSRAI
jgi:hypothetical protein